MIIMMKKILETKSIVLQETTHQLNATILTQRQLLISCKAEFKLLVEELSALVSDIIEIKKNKTDVNAQENPNMMEVPVNLIHLKQFLQNDFLLVLDQVIKQTPDVIGENNLM